MAKASSFNGLDRVTQSERLDTSEMANNVYLDWNATAPLRPQARAAMLAALDHAGNPSSVHADGRAARRLVETAREQVAALVGVLPRQVVFTSGGTEANALALFQANTAKVLCSAVEHPSILANNAQLGGEQCEVLPSGVVDLAALERRIAGAERPFVSIMLANNETGAIQPVAQAAEIVHKFGGLLHVDAVQGPGRIACDFIASGADLMTLSSHKLGGPHGCGALILKDKFDLWPLIRGGGQERGHRAGTENVAAIAGFGAAALTVCERWEKETSQMRELRDHLEAGVKAITPQAIVFSGETSRLSNTSLIGLAGMKAETAVIALDLDGISVSSGSACSSGKVSASHVLAAMDVAAEPARSAIRVSLGYTTTDRDIEAFLKAWEKLVKSLYRAGKNREIAA